MTREEFIAALAAANTLIPQVTTLVGLGAFAIDQLFGLWAERNPGKTFEEFIAELRANAADVQDLAEEALVARGYVKRDDGTFYRPL